MLTTTLIAIGAIAVLLILSGLFSGSETALTAASRARMHYLARKGDPRARIVTGLMGKRERLIGAILLGNNLVNILASAIATSFMIVWFGDSGVIYATLTMTALVLIFSEVLPKTYALHNPDQVALVLGRYVRIVVWAFSPITRGVFFIVRVTLAIFGVKVGSGAQLLSSADELRGVIDLHAREGRMVKPARDMLDSILDLDEVSVSEIMVHRRNMEMLDCSEPPERLVELVLTSPYTRLPLWQDNPENIVGILHAKDLLRALSSSGGKVSQLDILSLATDPWFVPETTTLREQLNAFRQKHSHFALVVDEYGALMGLVTLEDILEEIVGEISDEHDVAADGIRTLPDGSHIIDGTVTIRDLNRRFDWDLPDEEAATIAGLVIHEARIIPEVGQVFRFHGFRFEIMRRNKNRIVQLRVTPPAVPPITETP